MPIIVNLCGAPGAGKSTGASYVFSQLKMAGVNAELVTEFAKDKVWEETRAPFENQMYMFAKQWFRITRCENKVDVIVTDSPLILSIIYQADERLGEEFNALVLKIFNYYDNMTYFLNRAKPYNPVGRFQTEEESDTLSKKIKGFLDSRHILYKEVDGDIFGYDSIVNDVKQRIETSKKTTIRLGDILPLEEWYHGWQNFAASTLGIQVKPFQKTKYVGVKEVGSESFFSDNINELPSDCAMIAEKYDSEGNYLVIKIFNEVRTKK